MELAEERRFLPIEALDLASEVCQPAVQEPELVLFRGEPAGVGISPLGGFLRERRPRGRRERGRARLPIFNGFDKYERARGIDANPGLYFALEAMRCLGLDVGDKRIGIAISDAGALIASPRETLERKGNRKDIAHLLELARREEVSEILVGMPWNLDGSSGPQAEKVTRFVEALRAVTEIPITTLGRAPLDGRGRARSPRGRSLPRETSRRRRPGRRGPHPPELPRREAGDWLLRRLGEGLLMALIALMVPKAPME